MCNYEFLYSSLEFTNIKQALENVWQGMIIELVQGVIRSDIRTCTGLGLLRIIGAKVGQKGTKGCK